MKAFYVDPPPELESRLEPFNRLMKNYDRELEVGWCPDIKRWGVFHRTRKGELTLIHTAQTPDGGYRDLTELDVEIIGRRDMARDAVALALIMGIEDRNRALEEKHRKEQRELYGEIAKDHWRSIFKIPFIPVNIQFKKA